VSSVPLPVLLVVVVVRPSSSSLGRELPPHPIHTKTTRANRTVDRIAETMMRTLSRNARAA
jgi:hypothetical protein